MKTNVIFSVENLNAIKKQVSKIEGLKAGRKETKSLSGAIRVITNAKAWAAGYGEAFSEFGFTSAKDFNLKNFFDFLHPEFCAKQGKGKEQKTIIYVWATRKQTQGKGKAKEYVFDADGNHVFEAYKKQVKSFNDVVLYTIMQQSAEAKKQGKK